MAVFCLSLLLFCLHCPFIANAFTTSKPLSAMFWSKKNVSVGLNLPYSRDIVKQTFFFFYTLSRKIINIYFFPMWKSVCVVFFFWNVSTCLDRLMTCWECVLYWTENLRYTRYRCPRFLISSFSESLSQGYRSLYSSHCYVLKRSLFDGVSKICKTLKKNH